MKTIRRQDFLEVGSVVKVHGTKGELKFNLTRGIKLKEWAFLEFRGKPVPFMVEWHKADMQEEVILKLQGIDSMDAAATYIGRTLLLPKKQVKKESDIDTSLQLEGFMLIDDELGEIGLIEEVIENQFQALARISYKGTHVLIPLVEEIISEIDEEEKRIYASLPEGILEIN